MASDRDVTETRLPTSDDFPVTGPNALATFGQRAWARVFDELLLLVPVVMVLYLFYSDVITADSSTGTAPTYPMWLLVMSAVLSICYEVGLIAWRGQTVGKMILGVRVAQFLDGSGPSLGQAALRCLLPTAISVALDAVIGPVAPLLVAAFYCSVFLNPLLRGWHDLAAGTVVVRTR